MIRNLKLRSILGEFKIEDHTIVYHKFMAQLYNYCLKQGMEPGKIVPSRAFCSDESQGLPIILMSKHFGAFPFDHGLVGGIMAHGRHAPHSQHGKDLLILQASHVGYEPQSQRFGRYRRLQTEDQQFSPNCGKIHGTLEWYLNEYEFAQENILFHEEDGEYFITIDKLLLEQDYEEGLFLDLKKLIKHDDKTDEMIRPTKILSTSRVYLATERLVNFLQIQECSLSHSKSQPLGKCLQPSMFEFKRDQSQFNQMLLNLHEFMPWVVTSGNPMLSAAEINVQIEFDRAYRSIVREESYHGRNLIYVSGLNIDYSPFTGQHFPNSMFVPWAAYIQNESGKHYILEQDELYQVLMECSDVNEDQVNLDDMIWD